jgi:hypothetical protein
MICAMLGVECSSTLVSACKSAFAIRFWWGRETRDEWPSATNGHLRFLHSIKISKPKKKEKKKRVFEIIFPFPFGDVAWNNSI